MRHTRLQGRASCWLLGGVGCLGLLIIGVLAIVLGGRALFETVSKPVEQVLTKAQVVVPKQRAMWRKTRHNPSDWTTARR